MDITSYLLGKNSSGGGGGSSDLDWNAIGFNGRPQAINDGYNYAVQIMNNWDATSTMESKFLRDNNLLFMPLVDITKTSNLSNMFQHCKGLMQVADLDYSKATYLDYMFDGCNSLKSISNFNVTGRIQYVFQNCLALELVQGNLKPTNVRMTFYNCSKLKNIPLIDGSNISGNNALQDTFYGCTNLTDTSLDNILQMCIGVKNYSSAKTLRHLGISNTTVYPTSRIEALPHYQAFLDAGWTIS